MAFVDEGELPLKPIYHHIAVLRDELELRLLGNPLYSLRAFSGFLGLHPSALSRLLSGQQEISIRSALIVTAKLNLSRDREIQFMSSAICARHHSDLEKTARELNCNVVELSIFSPASDCR